MNKIQRSRVHCSCGDVEFEVLGAPIIRGYCHCTICQKFNKSRYADVSVYYAKNVTGLDESKIAFKVYKQPPLVRRGMCKQCRSPAIEKLHIPPLPKMLIVPSANIDDTSLLPNPGMHIFYDKRVGDIDDGLKKYSGYVSSQLGFSMGLIKGMLSSS